MDRRWWWRAAIAAVVVGFFVLVGRTAVLAFRSDAGRLSSADRAFQAIPAAPATTAPR